MQIAPFQAKVAFSLIDLRADEKAGELIGKDLKGLKCADADFTQEQSFTHTIGLP